VNEIIRLVRTRDELGGHFEQGPYKGDFFQLFVAAWDAGLFKSNAPTSLKLDSLTRIIEARDPDVFGGDLAHVLRRLARVAVNVGARKTWCAPRR